MIQIDDEKSYVSIVEEFSEMIFRIAYQNLFNIADAEDVVQEVFLKLLKRKQGYKDKEHLKAWLIRVTVNQCIDWKRAFKRRNEVILEDSSFPLKEEERSLLSELSQLPSEDRTVIYLYYYEGYSIKEIALAMGKKQNTINSRLTRARKKLKNLIEEGLL